MTKKCKPSKYVRTMMKTEQGEYVTARINLGTGVITPFTYKTKKKPPKGVRKVDYVPQEPFWVGCIPNVAERVSQRGLIQSSKAIENPYFGMLDNYDIYEIRSGGVGQTVSAEDELDEDSLDDAIASLVKNMPFIDNYFVGIAQLGESNPLSKNVMFRLLRTLPEISSNTIYQASNYSANYCQRLSTALRVFIKLTT